jgi:hypothetical protein
MPLPLSLMDINFLPPSMTQTSTSVAPASRAFSSSSLTTFTGFWITSPAAIEEMTSGGNLLIVRQASSMLRGARKRKTPQPPQISWKCQNSNLPPFQRHVTRHSGNPFPQLPRKPESMTNVDARVLEAFQQHGLVLPGDGFESFLDCCLAAVSVLSKEPLASLDTTEERRTYLAGKLADLQFQSVQGVHQLHPRLKAKQHELLLELAQELRSAAATKGRQPTTSAGSENDMPSAEPVLAATGQCAPVDSCCDVASPAANSVQRSDIVSAATPQLPAALAFRKSGLIPRTPLRSVGAGGGDLTSRFDDDCDDGVTRRITGEMATTELATADLQQLFLVR